MGISRLFLWWTHEVLIEGGMIWIGNENDFKLVFKSIFYSIINLFENNVFMKFELKNNGYQFFEFLKIR